MTMSCVSDVDEPDCALRTPPNRTYNGYAPQVQTALSSVRLQTSEFCLRVYGYGAWFVDEVQGFLSSAVLKTTP